LTLKNIFKALVVISFGLVIVLELLAWFHLPKSPDLIEFLKLDGEGSLLLVNWPLYVFIISTDLILTAALLSFHPLSRTLFLLWIVATLLLSFVWGYRVLVPVQAFFGYLQALVDGGILAIAYFTSVAGEFQNRSHIGAND
jgi:hypothetical protein